MSTNREASTLVDKIWRSHVITELSDGRTLLHIDRHFLHDGTSRQAFDGMRRRRRRLRNTDLTFAVVDHILSTLPGRTGESHPPGIERIHALRDNCREFDQELYDVDSPHQGIAHVVAPERGITLPGCTLVCGDSHTATNGGLGALAFGIGTTEVMHVMATQALLQRKPPQMRITFEGAPGPGVGAKDMILYFIARHGVAAGTGCAVEYAGSAIRVLPIEARMTVCNMSIELGARYGIVAPDDATFDYVAGRDYAPKGKDWGRALADWRELCSDPDAHFEREFSIDCSRIAPQISFGNSPQDTVGVNEPLPDPARVGDANRRQALERALAYMNLEPGKPLEGVPVDYAFIGSCTNARLSDLEAAARVLRGRKVKPGVTAFAVPGSMAVKRAAEAAGLARIFVDAGFEWRNAGCSMCVGSNGDLVPAGKRSISTTNRNFEHRQGPHSRTHLASPVSVAAAAVSGCITDPRKLLDRH
ncbi:MAG: 3-isopropylmalate dehydratase large subunit [Betaproteobacteria bacterium]|nr:3-isopropylmalate dehydratase large subunit [Betaproteobacteria bacterium]